jgi:hypothetical protein
VTFHRAVGALAYSSRLVLIATDNRFGVTTDHRESFVLFFAPWPFLLVRSRHAKVTPSRKASSSQLLIYVSMHALARCRARFCGQHVLAGAARPKASPAWVAVRSVKLFDKLIPEDDPETKKQKELERSIIKKKMQRSKIAEMLAAHKDKVRVGAAWSYAATVWLCCWRRRLLPEAPAPEL